MTERATSTSTADLRNSVWAAIGELTGGIRVEAEPPARQRPARRRKPPSLEPD